MAYALGIIAIMVTNISECRANAVRPYKFIKLHVKTSGIKNFSTRCP